MHGRAGGANAPDRGAILEAVRALHEREVLMLVDDNEVFLV